MLCNFLNAIYGRDTRSAQVLNIIFSGLWVIGLSLHTLGIVLLDLPSIMLSGINDLLVVASLSTAFSAIGLVAKGRQHQVLKFFGLSLGAVLQGVLANGYFTVYPPLEVMLVINLAVVFWLLGALLYITKCEGFDGKFTHKP